MKLKIFTTNKNNKIEISKQELVDLLNEAYWEGYYAHNNWTYNSPYTWTTTTSTGPYYYNGSNLAFNSELGKMTTMNMDSTTVGNTITTYTNENATTGTVTLQ